MLQVFYMVQQRVGTKMTWSFGEQIKTYNNWDNTYKNNNIRWKEELCNNSFNECKYFVLVFGYNNVIVSDFVLDLHLDIFTPLFKEVSNDQTRQHSKSASTVKMH